MLMRDIEDPERKVVWKGRIELFEREQCGLKGGIGVLGAAKDLVRVEGSARRRAGW